MKTLGNRDAVLAALIEGGDEGAAALALSFRSGEGWRAHVESLRADGYLSIREEPHTETWGDGEYDVRFVLPKRAAEAAACVADIEELRIALTREQEADPDPTTGYGDENKVRLHRAMGRSISGSMEVRKIMARHGFSFDELVEYPETEQVRGMVHAAWPMESLNRTMRSIEAEGAKA